MLTHNNQQSVLRAICSHTDYIATAFKGWIWIPHQIITRKHLRTNPWKEHKPQMTETVTQLFLQIVLRESEYKDTE